MNTWFCLHVKIVLKWGKFIQTWPASCNTLVNILITARIRNLREGNVFTCVCLFTSIWLLQTCLNIFTLGYGPGPGLPLPTWGPPPKPRPIQNDPLWGLPSDLFQLVHLKPTHLLASGQLAFHWKAFLLPPANEVWGKVMFSQVFVWPQVGVASQHASQVTCLSWSAHRPPPPI